MKRKKAFIDNCKKKSKFPSETLAKQKCVKLKEKGILLYQYKCNVCDSWHLTKHDSNSRNSVKKIVNRVQEKMDKDYEKSFTQEVNHWESKFNI